MRRHGRDNGRRTSSTSESRFEYIKVTPKKIDTFIRPVNPFFILFLATEKCSSTGKRVLCRITGKKIVRENKPEK